MKCAALVVLTSALCACAPRIPADADAKEILRAMDRPWVRSNGLPELMNENDAVDEQILSGICTGTPEWLEIASRIDHSNYVHVSEAISSALSVALTKSPTAVLARFEDACHEPDELPGSCVVPHWRATALAALETVKDPALAKKTAECAIDIGRSVGQQSIEEAP